MVALNFDASQYTPSTGTQDAIPAGWYNAMIDQSEQKMTKANDGSWYLELRFNIVDGQYAGRKVFERLNMGNHNPVAQKIAYEDMSAIAHAAGIIQVQDSSQLHGIPMKIKVKYMAADAQYEAKNEIKAYRNINDTSVQVGPTGPAVVGGPSAPAPTAPAAPAAPMAPPQVPTQTWQQPAAAPQAAPQAPQAPQAPAAPMAPPAQPAPAQQAPVQAPVAGGTWQAPAAAQPWQQPAGAAPAAPAAPQAPAAPAAPVAPGATPAWAQ